MFNTNLAGPLKASPDAEIKDDPGKEKAEEKRPLDGSHLVDAFRFVKNTTPLKR